MDTFFSADISAPVWAAITTLVVAAVAAALLGFRGIARLRRGESPQPESTAPESAPKASVVVIGYNDVDLSAFLDSLRSQDYPDYEVIVVSETSQRENDAKAEKYTFPEGGPTLKFCYFPPGSHAVSRKKLALTIGIKAAEGEVIVTTTSRCEIRSPQWLSAIMRNFSQYTDIVIGYAAQDFDELPKRIRPLRRFEENMTSAQWLSAAADGNTYRGDGMNLAYRRQVFFDVKGFAGSIELVNGEDDIFISSIATEANTRLELSEASIVTPKWGDEAPRLSADAREHYRFTSTYLPRKPFVTVGCASAAQWLGLAAAATAAGMALPNLLPLCVVAAVAAISYTVQALLYRKGARVLGDDSKWGLAPLFLLVRPIDNFIFSLSRRGNRSSNFTYRCN